MLTNQSITKAVAGLPVSVLENGRIKLPEFKTINVQDEKIGFDSFVSPEGFAYQGLPGLPLPFKVENDEVVVLPCDSSYAIKQRGVLGLERALHFFVREIIENNLHINNNSPFHPATKI